MPTTKRCSQCKEEKSTSEFTRSGKAKDGLRWHCKGCEHERYLKDRESKQARRREKYRTDPVFKARMIKEETEWKARQDALPLFAELVKLKKAARRCVHSAVRRGRLPRVTTLICVECGERQAEHYHHYKGYAVEHRLDVVAVCARCHGLERREDA